MKKIYFLLLIFIFTFSVKTECSDYTDCESCIADANCGYYADIRNQTQPYKYTCVEGTEFNCADPSCETEPHLYFHNYCPIDVEWFESRRAIRKYLPVPISHEIILDIITYGTWAPSAMDYQPWRFYVVENSTLITEISDYIVKVANGSCPPHVFYEAPIVIFIFTLNSCPGFSDVDVGVALQNVLLSAYSYGLATCPIGFSRLGEPLIREVVGAGEDEVFSMGVTLGHPAITAVHTRRPPYIKYID
ncbi:nad(p)h nitroreductase ydgi-related [Anaeramoeba ignava]|uniref:Nad(P)h nitroreductase ydgi-related n=1 Tax=Anaeramoeba ignava TaxID=1746090 RepID=A0A9Q0L8G6_ANAIG|nr:nad(p)h nitroreductase ydgi-related [Anaeramoeba ignava]